MLAYYDFSICLNRVNVVRSDTDTYMSNVQSTQEWFRQSISHILCPALPRSVHSSKLFSHSNGLQMLVDSFMCMPFAKIGFKSLFNSKFGGNNFVDVLCTYFRQQILKSFAFGDGVDCIIRKIPSVFVAVVMYRLCCAISNSDQNEGIMINPKLIYWLKKHNIHVNFCITILQKIIDSGLRYMQGFICRVSMQACGKEWERNWF